MATLHAPQAISGKRNTRRYHRVFFETNGSGPWACAICDGMVIQTGRGSQDGHIHHKDENPINDVPENLIIMHNACHARVHMIEIASQRPSAYYENIAARNRGRERDPELCERLRQAQLNARATCEKCGYTSSKTWVKRHHCPRP
jgi:rubrerythrin